jgi:hypothetical protein
MSIETSLKTGVVPGCEKLVQMEEPKPAWQTLHYSDLHGLYSGDDIVVFSSGRVELTHYRHGSDPSPIKLEFQLDIPFPVLPGTQDPPDPPNPQSGSLPQPEPNVVPCDATFCRVEIKGSDGPSVLSWMQGDRVPQSFLKLRQWFKDLSRAHVAPFLPVTPPRGDRPLPTPTGPPPSEGALRSLIWKLMHRAAPYPERVLDKLKNREPPNPLNLGMLGIAYYHYERHKEAALQFERADALTEPIGHWWSLETPPKVMAKEAVARVETLIALDRRDEALQNLEGYLTNGRSEKILEWARERSMELRQK